MKKRNPDPLLKEKLDWAEQEIRKEMKSIMELIREIKNSQPKLLEMITTDEVEEWLKDTVWVVYSTHIQFNKRLMVSVGLPGFRVLHGKEIIYDGGNLADAIKKYNNITTAPDLNDRPKIDN